MALAFVPGYSPATPRLLERFLPPLAEGVAAHYIQTHTRAGDLVLDPFGAAPAVAVEALRLGRRVVVAGFNPVSRLAVSLAVRPPSAAQLRAALTRLGDAPVGPGPNDRLEVYLRGLYRTQCPECEAVTTADSYVWDGASNQLVSKTYVCPNCGGPRESPADAADQALARRFSRNGPDYYFLLDRVAAIGDADRAHAEEAFAVYPPRTLAAIGTLLNKLEALDLERETRRLAAGLLVAALDASTALGQERPRALAVPRQYREANFWLAVENAVSHLAGAPAEEHAVGLEDLLRRREPGIYAHPGAARELAGRLPPGMVSMLISAWPRPNQAYWALSAVWSAWLWGRETAEDLRGMLRRRRYDWAGHAGGFQRTLHRLRPSLRRDAHVVALAAETEPGLTAAIFAAGAGAGLRLEGAALRADTAEAQVVWRAPFTPPAPTGAPEAGALAGAVRSAMLDVLRRRGEPTRWLTLHFAAWQRLAEAGQLAWEAAEPVAAVNQAIEAVGQAPGTLLRFNASSDSDLATGLWFAPGVAAIQPLADRVEAWVARHRPASEAIHEDELLRGVYGAFPGPETPGRALVGACVASYGRPVEGGLWQLPPEAEPAARAAEQGEILAALRALAGHLGFAVAGDNPQEWQADGQTTYVFAVITSAMASQHLLAPCAPARRRFLVVPNDRAALLEHKLRRDPRLRSVTAAGDWSIVKFSQVRRVLAEGAESPAAFEAALAGDPLEAAEQLSLLP